MKRITFTSGDYTVDIYPNSITTKTEGDSTNTPIPKNKPLVMPMGVKPRTTTVTFEFEDETIIELFEDIRIDYPIDIIYSDYVEISMNQYKYFVSELKYENVGGTSLYSGELTIITNWSKVLNDGWVFVPVLTSVDNSYTYPIKNVKIIREISEINSAKIEIFIPKDHPKIEMGNINRGKIYYNDTLMFNGFVENISGDYKNQTLTINELLSITTERFVQNPRKTEPKKRFKVVLPEGMRAEFYINKILQSAGFTSDGYNIIGEFEQYTLFNISVYNAVKIFIKEHCNLDFYGDMTELKLYWTNINDINDYTGRQIYETTFQDAKLDEDNFMRDVDYVIVTATETWKTGYAGDNPNGKIANFLYENPNATEEELNFIADTVYNIKKDRREVINLVTSVDVSNNATIQEGDVLIATYVSTNYGDSNPRTIHKQFRVQKVTIDNQKMIIEVNDKHEDVFKTFGDKLKLAKGGTQYGKTRNIEKSEGVDLPGGEH